MATPHYKDLMNQLQAQLVIVANPFGVPVHRGVEASLNLIADIFTELHALDAPDIDPNDLESIIEALKQLNEDLKENSKQDKAYQEKLNELIPKVEKLGRDLNDLSKKFENEIATKIDLEQAQNLIRENLVLFQNTDDKHTKDITQLDARVKILEEGDPVVGVSEARAREIVKEELDPVKADLKNLKDNLDPRVAALEPKVSELERRLAELERKASGEGLPESEVRRIIQEEIEKI